MLLLACQSKTTYLISGSVIKLHVYQLMMESKVVWANKGINTYTILLMWLALSPANIK